MNKHRTLTPSQIHYLTILASSQCMTLQAFMSSAHIENEFSQNLLDAYDTFLAGDTSVALGQLKWVISTFYNIELSLQTESNRQWLFSLYYEFTGDELLARSIFYSDSLSLQEQQLVKTQRVCHQLDREAQELKQQRAVLTSRINENRRLAKRLTMATQKDRVSA